MKCVVTGATGHIGNVLVRQLLEQGYEVRAFVREGDSLEALKGLKIEIVYGDVRNLSSLKKAFTGYDVVFHLAGIIEIGSGNKKSTYHVNVEGSKNVVQACKEVGVKKLVYTSSVHAIEEKPAPMVITETDTFSPNLVKGTYAKTKAEATDYILHAADDSLEVIIVHPSGVIGPYEYMESNLGRLIQDCMNHKIGAYVKGAYNFVDVRDVAKGIILAEQKGRNKECYILAGHVVTVKELMNYVQDITGVKAPKFKIARWFAIATGFLSELYSKAKKEKPLFTAYAIYTLGTNSNFSIEKAQKELGYCVREIKDTLTDTIAWFKDRKSFLL